MKYWVIALFAAVFTAFFSPAALAAKLDADKLSAVAWVVYCEDHTDMRAAKLVLSTVYNRAKSHDIDKLYKAVSAKGQYHCHRIKPKAKALNSKKYREIHQLVTDFTQGRKPPITNAMYFYNHKLVPRSALGKMRLTVAQVHGSHTYLY